MGSGDVTGVEVDNLHGTGGTIKGRSENGRAAANGLKNGLDSASTSVGHSRVKGALTSYVTNHVVDDSNKLGVELDTAGSNVEYVAASARSSDEEGARTLQTTVSENTGISDRINRAV
ncbi:MAG: hypothetical protein PGN07_02155 [Aeromicrobium erythreum]